MDANGMEIREIQEFQFITPTFAPTPVNMASDLTIVVPILNERDNLEPLLGLVAAALEDISWEVIFVDDDSSDGTADHARLLARRNLRVRCLHRIGRRGLSTACIEGVLASASPYVAVMDGDLQHDEQLLPHMLDVLRREPVDLVVGSRYVAGGEIGEGLSSSRARVSGFATWLARFICKAEIADPMSGFFMCRREVFEGGRAQAFWPRFQDPARSDGLLAAAAARARATLQVP